MQPCSLTISLNSFYYWFYDEDLVKVLSWLLPTFAKKVGGFEINLHFAEFDSWVRELNYGMKCLPGSYRKLSEFSQASVLKCTANSLHIGDIKDLPKGEEKWFGYHLNEIKRLTGISKFTTHPDEVIDKRWNEVCKYLNKGISLSIENMCYRKVSHNSLEEIEQVLVNNSQIQVTFDISHWTEQGKSLRDPQLSHFLAHHAHRIDKIHVSAPISCSSEYDTIEDSNHFVCFNPPLVLAGNDLKDFLLSCNATIVLEGLIPVQSIALLDQEIEFVSRICTIENDSKKAAIS